MEIRAANIDFVHVGTLRFGLSIRRIATQHFIRLKERAHKGLGLGHRHEKREAGLILPGLHVQRTTMGQRNLASDIKS
jgi:hypothetical protein